MSDYEGKLFQKAKRLPNRYRIFAREDIPQIKRAWQNPKGRI
jgi:hypothetical protein